jgi:predicted transcriptional regulator
MMADETSWNAVELATELTIAWLGNANNRPSADEVPTFLRAMHATVSELAGVPGSDQAGNAISHEDHVPAVTVRRSLASKDHILSMIDGKPYKALRRHLTTNGLTPEQYRERYNLRSDYPMVSENYSAARRDMALRIGLGSKGRKAKADGAAATATMAKRPGRKPKTAE